MSAQVQQLVDELAEVLQRSVAVDDPDIQLIAASPHLGAIDSTRMDVILSRKTQPRIVEFARSLHLEHARGPRRITGSPELDILPRVVFPVRDHDELYGYLWLIDVSPPVTEADVEVAAATVEAIAKALASETRAEDSRHAEDAELVSALLSEDPDRRREATSRAERAGRLRTDRPWRVAAVRLAAEQCGGDQSNLAHASAVMRGVLSRPLSAIGDDEFVVISDDDGWDPVPRGKRPSVRPAWERLRSVLDSRGLTLESVGVSPRLEDEPLHFARRRAHYCAHVASTIPSYGGVAHWEQLGAWQLLYGLPWTPQTVRTLHPGIEILLRPPHRELAVTLATYLDRGGDTSGTVEALRVHRATLYYRRDRIRALIGTDWESGWGRVGAHAALMLAGLLDPGVAAVPRPGAGEAVQADTADSPTRWTASRPR